MYRYFLQPIDLISHEKTWKQLRKEKFKRQGGAHGVMVIVVGNGHGDTNSNPGRDWLHFT